MSIQIAGTGREQRSVLVSCRLQVVSSWAHRASLLLVRELCFRQQSALLQDRHESERVLEYSRDAHLRPIVDAETTISASCSSRGSSYSCRRYIERKEQQQLGQLEFASRESLAGIDVIHMAEDSTQLPNNYTRTRKWSRVNRNREKETGGCWKEVQVKAGGERASARERETERQRKKTTRKLLCAR